MLGFDEHGEMGEDLQGESRTINDVLLPPWAKNATDFIQLNAKVSSSIIMILLFLPAVCGHR